MILAHALSQVRHPQNSLKTALTIIENTPSLLGLNVQPADDVSFVHPLFTTLRFLFGGDWVQEPQMIKVPIDDKKDRQLHDYYSYSSYSSWDSKDYQRRENTKKKAITVSLAASNMMKPLLATS